MPINMDKTHFWKVDIEKSVDFYNNWFIRFAPKAYRETRIKTTKQVENVFRITGNLIDLSPKRLRDSPEILPVLRMCTAPPIARDRLIGLADVSPNLVKSMETKSKIPPKMGRLQAITELNRIKKVLLKLFDSEIFPWLENNSKSNRKTLYRSATVIADRLCGSIADPIIRNAQETRQLNAIERWLSTKGYKKAKPQKLLDYKQLNPGEFSFRLNVKVQLPSLTKIVNIPVDVVIKPKNAKKNDFPILIEAKSSGDFTNTNKRRKEEAIKMSQLKANYGDNVKFVLFLCGYFDSSYLGYEAAEGIDWIWEHRIEDLNRLGV